MEFEKITENSSNYRHLEKMSVKELLLNMNKEDQSVPLAIAKVADNIEAVVNLVSDHMLAGGRLFYLGAGTSGRLGIVDASECPPTFGVDHGLVIGLIAGGDKAIRKAVEFAEDDYNGGWEDLLKHNISSSDVVLGIAASGTTPYVIGALEKCNTEGISTACITCNPESPLDKTAQYPIACPVGPEFVTGSTRMKAGTAQKLILNMISTAVMIKIGRVKDNQMVDMQLSNNKLVDRGTKMVMKSLKLSYEEAKNRLLTHGSVRNAIESDN
jgi:N-acetylmuramic acid 6-phosphate etherase